MLNPKHGLWALLLPGLLSPLTGSAQIDPVKRELFQFGYGQPFEGRPPVGGYAFYYHNQPDFITSNLTLRLAIAPVYVDSELGISHALGRNTDLGIGLAGGGFADSYYEVRQGQYLPSESFPGHGATASLNVYHLFDPGRMIPLNGVFRVDGHYADYERDDHTDPNFVLPPDQATMDVRAGLRFGGMEPVIAPELAMELSLWYQGEFRTRSGPYGFNGDRDLEPNSHLFWGRALLAYTFPESKQNFMVNLTAGTSINPDRFSAYRLGGLLPLASEFPLILPGYYYQEITAQRFALLNLNYSIPLDERKRWAINVVGSTAVVDYLPGLEQPGNTHTGVGGGITYASSSGAWHIMLDYGYGFNALRSNGSGSSSIGILLQWNLVRSSSDYYDPSENNFMIRGLDRFLHSFY